MLIKLKFKLDEDEIPVNISEEDYALIMYKYREVYVTIDSDAVMNQLFALNGHLVAYNPSLVTSSFGVVTELLGPAPDES